MIWQHFILRWNTEHCFNEDSNNTNISTGERVSATQEFFE